MRTLTKNELSAVAGGVDVVDEIVVTGTDLSDPWLNVITDPFAIRQFLDSYNQQTFQDAADNIFEPGGNGSILAAEIAEGVKVTGEVAEKMGELLEDKIKKGELDGNKEIKVSDKFKIKLKDQAAVLKDATKLTVPAEIAIKVTDALLDNNFQGALNAIFYTLILNAVSTLEPIVGVFTGKSLSAQVEIFLNQNGGTTGIVINLIDVGTTAVVNGAVDAANTPDQNGVSLLDFLDPNGFLFGDPGPDDNQDLEPGDQQLPN